MARFFGLSAESAASVEQVHWAYSREEYWYARFAAFDATTSLDSLAVEDGVVRVAMTQDLRHDVLPRLLSRLYPGDLKVRSTETWSPTGDGRFRGEITTTAVGAPGSGHGAGTLAPHRGGSQLHLSATVEFNVPLVGGRIENYLGTQLTEQIPLVQRFTTEWIADHA